MKYFKLFIPALVLSFLVFSCRDEDNINNPIIGEFDDLPVIVNTENSFTFTVNASKLDYYIEDNLTFTKDSLVCAVTLTNASSDGSIVRLFDESNSIIFAESLNQSKVVVNTELNGKLPKKIIIDLFNFTGQLTIVVAPENP